MSYTNFAAFYDGLQANVDYKARAAHIIGLFKKYDRLPTLLLDLACGTGGFSLEMAKAGIDVIGVDSSVEMLNVARQKCFEQKANVLLLCQSAEKLDLYGTVDGAICCLDSVNHIIDENELLESFKKVSLFLEKDRLFIFDVNSEYKHRKVLSGNVFVGETEDVFYAWRNSDCDEKGVVDIRLDFFQRLENGYYQRSFEEFSERAYLSDELEKMLDKAGLQTVAVLGDMSETEPSESEERIIYVTRKR